MKKEDLFEALEGASDAYLESAAEAMMAKADTAQTVIPGGGKHRRWKQFLKHPRSWISAACILLSVSLLAVTLLLGSMHGFYLGPLDTEYKVPEKVMEELRNMAQNSFQDMPWDSDTDTIRAYAAEQGCLVLDKYQVLEGGDLLEAFYERTKQGEQLNLNFINLKYRDMKAGLLYFDGDRYHRLYIWYDGREYCESSIYLLRFERNGEDEKGTYIDTAYYMGDLELTEIEDEHFGELFVHVEYDNGILSFFNIKENSDKYEFFPFLIVGMVRTYIEEDDPDSVSLRYDQATDCFEIVYSDGRKETYRECDLFTVIRDALHGDYITDPFSSAVPEGFYIASFETPVKLSPVDPETLDIDSLPSPFSNKDNEAVFMSKDCLWLKIGTDWYACARENLPWVK